MSQFYTIGYPVSEPIRCTRLPTEVFCMALAYCNPLELQRASLVCKTWYSLALPYLYRNVAVETISHLERLITTLELETSDNYDGPRFSRRLRSLWISLGFEDNFDKAHPLMVRLKQIIPKLVSLEHLGWGDCQFDVSDLFECFRTSCPKLRMFTRTLPIVPEYSSMIHYLSSRSVNVADLPFASGSSGNRTFYR